MKSDAMIFKDSNYTLSHGHELCFKQAILRVL